jgi:RNA 2',3'-cyclic 3'-phosphodiesterase
MTTAPRPLRLFVGARVSLATVRALDEAVRALRRMPEVDATGPRWVPAASYHVTVTFLGWTRPEVVAAIRDEVAAGLAGVGAFDLECRGLGAFPSADRARVLWAGVDATGGGRLGELAERVEEAAARLGFERERRAYHAHVTLARWKAPANVRRFLDGVAEQVYRSSWVDSLVLFESKMNSSGSEYSEVASWSLDSGSKRPWRHTAAVEPGNPATGDRAVEAATGAPFTHEDELGLPPHQGSRDPGEPRTDSAAQEQDDDGDQY